MSKKYKNIDELFRQKLANHGEYPPTELKDAVFDSLSYKKKRVFPAFLWIAAASIGLIFAIGSVLYVVSYSGSGKLTVLTDKHGDEKSATQVGEITLSEDSSFIIHNNTKSQRLSNQEVALDEKHDDQVGAETEKSIISASTDEMYKADQKKVETLLPAPIPEISNGYSGSMLAYSAREISLSLSGRSLEEDESLEKAKLLEPSIEVDHNNYRNYASQSIDQAQMNDLLAGYYAKQVPKKTRMPGNWAVGAQATPLYSYRNLSGSSPTGFDKSHYNDFEKPLISIAGGLNVFYQVSDKIGIKTGIYFQRIGQTLESSALNIAANSSIDWALFNRSVHVQEDSYIDNSVGQINTSESLQEYVAASTSDQLANGAPYSDRDVQSEIEELDLGFVMQFNYLEIPLLIKYSIYRKFMDVNVLSGITANILLGNSVYMQNNNRNENIGEIVDLSPVNYSMTLGIGLDYPVFRSFKLSIEPTFKYYLMPISENSDIKFHPYAFGVFSGIFYQF